MFKNLIESGKSIKNLRVLCATALLSALFVALYAVKIPLGANLRITFTFVPIAIAGWLFGIVPAIIVGALGDFLGCLFFPQGAYFFGFTLTSMLSGLFFGSLLYKKKGIKLLLSIILSKLLISLFLNVGLNTYWTTFFSSELYFKILKGSDELSHFLTFYISKPLFLLIQGKLIKNGLMLPVEIAILFAVIEGLRFAGMQKMYK